MKDVATYFVFDCEKGPFVRGEFPAGRFDEERPRRPKQRQVSEPC